MIYYHPVGKKFRGGVVSLSSGTQDQLFWGGIKSGGLNTTLMPSGYLRSKVPNKRRDGYLEPVTGLNYWLGQMAGIGGAP